MNPSTETKDLLRREKWRGQIDTAISEFTQRTRVTRSRLALALGLYDAALYTSHLAGANRGEDYRNKILFALNGKNLLAAAATLDLDDAGYAALREMSAALYRQILHVDVDLSTPRVQKDEAIGLGLAAVDQLDAGRWDVAVPRLERAWQVLAPRAEEATGTALRATLRVGTQLAGWRDTQGERVQMNAMVRLLMATADAYRGANPTTLAAIGNVYKVAAMAERHQGVSHPARVVDKLRHAQTVFQSIQGSDHDKTERDLGQATALRDQALPYLAWGVGWRGRPGEADMPRRAEAGLVQAEALAGGGEERDDPRCRIEWFFTRCTHIEVTALALADSGEQQERRRVAAQRLWDEMMDEDWVQHWLDPNVATPISVKRDYARFALLFSGGDLEALAAEADRFCGDGRNQTFGDRVTRAKRIATLASQGDTDAIRQVFFG